MLQALTVSLNLVKSSSKLPILLLRMSWLSYNHLLEVEEGFGCWTLMGTLVVAKISSARVHGPKHLNRFKLLLRGRGYRQSF